MEGPSKARTIVVCKLGWWRAAPWDVRAYAAGHSTYPTDSTLNQLYDSAEFDAYRELGWCTADLAIAPAKPPAQTPVKLPSQPPRQPRSASAHVRQLARRTAADVDLQPFQADQDAAA